MHGLSRSHIKYVLGIDVPLNEQIVISERQAMLIVESQLLYESFLNSLKDYAKEKIDKAISTVNDWKDSAVVLYKILSDEKTIQNFSDNLWKTFKNSSVLKTLRSYLEKFGVLDSFDKIIDKVTALSGWKKFLSATAIATAGKFLHDTIGKLSKEQVLSFFKMFLSDQALTTVTSSILSGGFSALVGWFESAKIGVKTLYNTLAPTIKKFAPFMKEEQLNEEVCCSRQIALHETVNRLLISEGLNYHLQNKIDLNESIYRPQSTNFLALFEEARALYDQGKLQLSEQDEAYFSETDLGLTGIYNGVKVPLDFPMTIDFLMEVKKKAKKQPPLNKPKRGGSKKFYVYVRKPGGGIKKVSFGDTSGLSAKINNPEARRSFAARHKCSQAKDKTTPKYWSCRLPRYASLLGLKSNFSGFW